MKRLVIKNGASFRDTVFYMQNTIETIRNRGYERYEAARRFEEMTDIAERLGYPIDTTISYEMRDGAAYARSDTQDRPFHNQTLLALQRGQGNFTGDQAFEVERLRLEHEEALMVDAFGRGELDGSVLVKFSKVPDAVVNGETSIKGYRRDLLRSFARIYYKTEQGLDCRLFTLDHNSPAGMRAVGELLGIDTLDGSERVLADSSVIATSEPEMLVDELVERAKLVYDDARYRETGERSYAGSQFVDKQNAMNEITNQSFLVDSHMQAIADIVRLGRGEEYLEQERKNTAAAIKLASQGVRISSNSDGAVSAEVASGNYDRECATGSAANTDNGMNQAAKKMENIWRSGQCQVCFAHTMVGSCFVCSGCAALDDMGADLLKIREKNLRALEKKRALARVGIANTNAQPMPERRPVRTQGDDNVTRQRVLTIGGSYISLRDKETGVEIARV